MWMTNLVLILCCTLQVFADVKTKMELEHSIEESYDEGETNPCDGYNEDQEQICQLILRLTAGDSTLGPQLQQAVDNETIKCAHSLKRQRKQFVDQLEITKNALSVMNISLQGLIRREQELVEEANSAKEHAEDLQDKLDEVQNKTIDDAATPEITRLDEELAVARKRIVDLDDKVEKLKREKTLLKFHFKRISAQQGHDHDVPPTQQECEKNDTLSLELEQARKTLELEREKSLQQHSTVTRLVEHLETKLALSEANNTMLNATIEVALEKERQLLLQLETAKQQEQILHSMLHEIISEVNMTKIQLSSCNESHRVCSAEEAETIEKHREATRQLQVCEELRRVTPAPPPTATPAPPCNYIICKTPLCLNANATKAAAFRTLQSSPRNVGNLQLISINGRQYYFEISNKRTWFDALAFCSSNGMQLANLETATEHNAVYNHLRTHKNIFLAVYTSLNRVGSRCNYAWENGAALTYTNWRPGDPYNQATEECMILMDDAWADVPCEQKHSFLCETLKP